MIEWLTNNGLESFGQKWHNNEVLRGTKKIKKYLSYNTLSPDLDVNTGPHRYKLLTTQQRRFGQRNVELTPALHTQLICRSEHEE